MAALQTGVDRRRQQLRPMAFYALPVEVVGFGRHWKDLLKILAAALGATDREIGFEHR
jgi:hypothetical protein